ncbi:MAG: hypothetical protein WAV15_01170 [Minisyncoccia bacterium]
MKKYLVGLLFLIIITPSIALASWWNPFSWFRKNPIDAPTVTTPVVQPTIATPTTPPVVEKKNEIPKPVIKSTPKPQTVTSSNNLQSVQEAVKQIDFHIKDYQKFTPFLEEKITLVNTYKDKYLKKTTDIDESSGALYLATSLKLTLNFQQLIDAMKLKIAELQKARTEILTKNTVDKSVWSESKNQEYLQFSTNTANTYKVVSKEWSDNMTDILEFLKLISPQGFSKSSGSVGQRDPYVQEQLDYYDKLEEVRAQVKAEIESGGGYASDSNVYSIASKRLKDMGVKPPISPYGGYINPTGGYTSVMCHSLGSGFDCYGSDGARIQSNQIPGSSSFQINSW